MIGALEPGGRADWPCSPPRRTHRRGPADDLAIIKRAKDIDSQLNIDDGRGTASSSSSRVGQRGHLRRPLPPVVAAGTFVVFIVFQPHTVRSWTPAR